MDITFSNIPPNTPFDVNIRFGNANSYIKVPINPSITQGSSSGTLNLPFSLSASACNNLDDIKHQIRCYESVSVGGKRVSREQARQLVLSCQSGASGGSTFSGTGSFCAYNYPRTSCEQVRQSTPSGWSWMFVPGTGIQACGDFPDVERTYDFGFISSRACSQLGGCGACILAPPN